MGKLLGPDGRPLSQKRDEPRLLGLVVQTPSGFTAPWPEKHMEPDGFLTRTLEAAALWKFLGDAMAALDSVPKTIALEGDADTEVSLFNIAHGIASMYGVEKADMFSSENVWRARAQAEKVNRAIDQQILLFIATRGKNGDFIGRDSSADVK